jgi:hypothetical protein
MTHLAALPRLTTKARTSKAGLFDRPERRASPHASTAELIGLNCISVHLQLHDYSYSYRYDYDYCYAPIYHDYALLLTVAGAVTSGHGFPRARFGRPGPRPAPAIRILLDVVRRGQECFKRCRYPPKGQFSIHGQYSFSG